MPYKKIEELVEEHVENKGIRKRDGMSHSPQTLWTSSRNGTQMKMPTPVDYQHGEHVLTDCGKLLCIPTAPQPSQCQHLGNGTVAPCKQSNGKGTFTHLIIWHCDRVCLTEASSSAKCVDGAKLRCAQDLPV
jgi:hypothetical protein